MEIGSIRMSSKGQSVIPAWMRRDLDEGEQLVIIREGSRFIVKLLDDPEPAMGEDLGFSERTEKAYLEYEKGEYTKEKEVDFL